MKGEGGTRLSAVVPTRVSLKLAFAVLCLAGCSNCLGQKKTGASGDSHIAHGRGRRGPGGEVCQGHDHDHRHCELSTEARKPPTIEEGGFQIMAHKRMYKQDFLASKDLKPAARRSSEEEGLSHERALTAAPMFKTESIPSRRTSSQGRTITIQQESNGSDAASCRDLEWADLFGDTCAVYLREGWCLGSWQPSYADENGIIADEACCGCGGGTYEYCVDEVGWVDSQGRTCAHYAVEGWCAASWQGEVVAGENGITADAACCACGGGGCRDHASWEAQCPLWRSNGWCLNNTEGLTWNVTANGTFDQHVIDGVTVSEGCCGCGRLRSQTSTLEHYLSRYRSDSERVTEVLLNFSTLSGEIPSQIGKFTNLEVLDLQGNFALSGQMPVAIAQLSELRLIDLSSTVVGGELPNWLGDLPLLEHVLLAYAHFSGTLPLLTSFSSLVSLDLGHNRLIGSLPATIPALSALELLDLSANSMTGALPHSIRNLTALTHLLVDSNSLRGALPDSIGGLTVLQYLDAASNHLTGALPAAIAAMQSLQNLQLHRNELKGSIPPLIGELRSLQLLRLGRSELTGTVPERIGDLQSLRYLDLDFNALRGSLPDGIGKLAALQRIYIYSNSLSGSLPRGLWHLSRLRDSLLWGNAFTGSIPSSVGLLTDVGGRLDLGSNRLAGEVPPEIFALTRLTLLSLSGNSLLQGFIPPAVGNMSHLYTLDLSGTMLAGTLPAQIGKLTSLLRLDLFETRMRGAIPAAVGGCTLLTTLDLHGSNFDGTLPPEFAAASKLSQFMVSHNRFTGSLPQEYGRLSSLEYFDISNNQFSGEVKAGAIPLTSLKSLSLENNALLSGELPALNAASSLTTLLAANCNFTSTNALPASLQHVDLSGNQLSQLPEDLYVLPNVEVLLLSSNVISSWPPRGAYSAEFLAVGLCANTVLEANFEWPNLKVLDVSHNPLEIHVYIFLQTLFWSRSLSEIRAERCHLYGDIPRFLFRTFWGTINCVGLPAMQNGLQSLLRLNLRDNSITSIVPEPPPVLLLARFDNNKLNHLARSWFNEGLDQATQARRYTLSVLNITGNPSLRFSVLPPHAECGPQTAASNLSTDPRSLEQRMTGSAVLQGGGDEPPYHCGSPCPPSGMSLSTDVGLPDEGSLCRCKEGYGLLPEQCWDGHWRDANGLSCRDHLAERDSCNGNAEVASVCCGCGGQGDGGNGRNCSRCPADTYSFSSSLDSYRHRSQCVHCPAGATTAPSEDGGGGRSLCDCVCPVGTFLQGGEHCQETQPHLFFSGRESCQPCHFLKTTLRSGSLRESDCICDTMGIAGLVDAAPLCGCKQGYYLNTKGRQCQTCAEEGERCDWNGDMDASVNPPELAPGFWTATAWIIGLNDSERAAANFTFDGHSIYKCFSTKVCLDSRGSCARGRVGRACSLCRPGFYGGSEGECLECRGSAIVGLAAMVLSIPVVVIVAHLILSGSDTDTKGLLQSLRSFRVSLKQFLTHFQAVSIVGGFAIKWPVDVRFIFDFVSKYSFRFTDAFGVGCLKEQQSASLELGFRFIFPVIFVVIGIFLTPLVAGVLAQLLRVCIPKWSRLEQFRLRVSMSLKDAAKSVFWCCALFFATFFKIGLLLFTCNMNPNGERTVQAYPHLHCMGSKSGADSEFLMLAAPAAVYTVVCLVSTVAIYYRAWKKTKRCLEESDLQHRGNNAFLFEDFRNARLHWPMILMARHALVNLTGAALSGLGPWQLLTAVVINAFVAVWCFVQTPYIDGSNNLIETMNSASLVAVCTFTAGMGFAAEPGIQDLQSLATGAAGDAAISLRAKMLMVFLLISVFGPMMIVVYQIILLFPNLSKYLPKRMRPLTSEEEDNIRHFLRVAEGENDLHRIFDKLDGEELLHISRYLHAAPASVGVLRHRGQSPSIYDLVERGRSSQSVSMEMEQRAPSNGSTDWKSASQSPATGPVSGKDDHSGMVAADALPLDQTAVDGNTGEATDPTEQQTPAVAVLGGASSTGLIQL